METPMKYSISRRTLLKGSCALLAGAAFSTRVMADAPAAEPVTPALIEAARKEGQVIYYTRPTCRSRRNWPRRLRRNIQA
jgi:iron(III) transport system substrate-binding protein